MALLKVAVALLALGGCYSPELRDCTVACASADDCGPGQTCGADRWCASPSLAGRCAVPDGDVPVDAASATDATAITPDASVDAAVPAPVLLVVQISGHGMVSIAGVGTCADTSPGHECTFAVTAGVTRMLVATGTGADEFEQWMQACATQGSTCTLTPTGATTTTQAKFKH